jgi:hypothetical protein
MICSLNSKREFKHLTPNNIKRVFLVTLTKITANKQVRDILMKHNCNFHDAAPELHKLTIEEPKKEEPSSKNKKKLTKFLPFSPSDV